MTSTSPTANTTVPGRNLSRLLAPRSIAVVGAGDTSPPTRGIVEALQRVGFSGRLHMVNRRGTPVLGRPAATNCQLIGEPVDLAVLFVPPAATLDVLDDVGAAGIPSAFVYSGGWAEVGGEGRRRQEALVARARSHGVTLIGPNCIGFVNFAARSAAYTFSVAEDMVAGSIGVVSQSGGMGSLLLDLAAEFRIGLSCVVTTGNEAMVSTTDVVEHLVDDPDTAGIALFVEQIRDPPRFLDAARRARAAGKPVVVLKAGRTERAAATARAHTASLVGDDRIVDAAFRQHAIVRVSSLEDLLLTTALIVEIGVVSTSGVGMVTMNGGTCSIVADQAGQDDVDFPQLRPATVSLLRETLNATATPNNPLDIAGGSSPEQFAEAISIVAAQDDVGMIAAIAPIPAYPSDKDPALGGLLAGVAKGFHDIDKPAVLISQTFCHLNMHARAAVAQAGIRFCLPGMMCGVKALGHLGWWSAQLRRQVDDSRSRSLPHIVTLDADASGVLSEWQARAILTSAGVPVIEGELASTREDAVAAAKRLGGPVAVKVVAPGLLHKSDLGAVMLGVRGDAAVSDAFDAVVQAWSTARPGVPPTGALVTPMRPGGVELLVGVHLDSQWGAVLVVGLGGVWVEAMDDTATRILPVTTDEALAMLTELRAAALLRGARGHPGVDMGKVAGAIVAIGNAALALGDRLASLEVNPLWANTQRVEALDALVVLQS